MDAVHITVLAIAGFFTLLTIISTSFLIHGHMRNYTKPEHQKFIIRILFMPIIYAVDSWISLYFKHDSWAIFIDIGRDCYEAYVIYSFFKLLVCYLGGKEAVCALVGKRPSFDFLPFYLAHDGNKFYHRCLQGIIQYVLLRPTLAIIAAILHIFNKYGDGIFDWDKGYVYILILNNIAVSIALYCLGMFYQRFELELRPHQPILKFMVIKGVVFFTFWQSVGIVILGWIGVIPDTTHHSKTTISFFLNDTLICAEMFIAAIAHYYAFPYQQYQTTRQKNLIASSTGVRESSSAKTNYENSSALSVLGHVANQGDVARDAVASVVGGDEGSFVEYQKFTNADELSAQKAKQFSIIKRQPTPTTIRSPLIETHKDRETDEFENSDHVGIDIREFAEQRAEEEEGRKKSKKGGRRHKQAANEFVEEEKEGRKERENEVKFGDAILTKAGDEEVQDARYEINLL